MGSEDKLQRVVAHTDQQMTEQFMDILRDVAKTHSIDYEQWNPNKHRPGTRVLVFGKPEDENLSSYDLVQTYSPAQVLTKANAATVLDSSIRLYLSGKVVPKFEADLIDHVPSFSSRYDFNKPIAIDIETSGNFVGKNAPLTIEEIGLLTVAVYQEGLATVIDCRGLDSFDLVTLGMRLSSFEHPVYHNGKFDIRVLSRVLKTNLKNWFDTMLAHHVLNQAAGEHGLKPLAQRYFGAEDWESNIKQYLKDKDKGYEQIPFDILAEYNAYDVFWTMQLYELLAPQIEADENSQKAFLVEMKAAEFLLKVEKRGIPIHSENMAALSIKSRDDKQEALRNLLKVTGSDRFNPNSPKQVKDWLAEHGFNLSSTNEESIKQLLSVDPAEHVREFCEQLLAFRKAAKVESTYVGGWSRATRYGRVHPTFLVHGSSTGRLSSSSPNAQNMPRDKEIRAIVGFENG